VQNNTQNFIEFPPRRILSGNPNKKNGCYHQSISLPQDFQNCPGMGKNTIPGLFLAIAFVGLKVI